MGLFFSEPNGHCSQTRWRFLRLQKINKNPHFEWFLGIYILHSEKSEIPKDQLSFLRLQLLIRNSPLCRVCYSNQILESEECWFDWKTQGSSVCRKFKKIPNLDGFPWNETLPSEEYQSGNWNPALPQIEGSYRNSRFCRNIKVEYQPSGEFRFWTQS